MSRREEILSKIATVPALPTTGAKVISMLQNPDVGISEVMQVIEFDPGLTSNLLRLANSAYFATGNPVVSLRDAGVRLGLNRVFQLVLTLSMSRWTAQPVRGYSLPPGDLLEHSVAVAIGAEQLAQVLGRKAPGHAFTSGLLHDIGKVVLGTFVEIDVSVLLRMAFEEKVSFEVAEQRVLGIDHAEAGGFLLEQWGLPAGISESVKLHHRPLDAAGDTFVVDLVHVSDALTLESGIGMGIDGLNYSPCPSVAERLHLKPLMCETVVAKVLSELEGLREVLELGTRR